jgi:16S rRNA processing protein RimM
MTYKAKILLGRIVKLHGYNGSVTIRLEKNFINNLPEMGSVFLEVEGKPVPFLISNTEYHGSDNLMLTFDGYESAGKVSEFPGCRVFLTNYEITDKGDTIPGLNELLGFSVLQNNNIRIGIIDQIIENPGNILLNVLTQKGKKILIPFHPDLIKKLNHGERTIEMDLPEGLSAIN